MNQYSQNILKNKLIVSSKIDPIYIECPNCNFLVEILSLNCGIFRHGVFKNTHQQLDPHASKDFCDMIVDKDLIYGCGKPFKVELINNKYIATICDYI